MFTYICLCLSFWSLHICQTWMCLLWTPLKSRRGTNALV